MDESSGTIECAFDEVESSDPPACEGISTFSFDAGLKVKLTGDFLLDLLSNKPIEGAAVTAALSHEQTVQRKPKGVSFTVNDADFKFH